MISKKHIGIGVALLVISVFVTALIMQTYYNSQLLNFYGNIGVTFETGSVHSRIRIWKGDELVLDEWHAGVVTNIGDNQTLYWIFGDSAMKPSNGSYTYNATYISIGNQTNGLDSTATQLPNEWNRTTATIEDQTQSQLNLTCTFYPDVGAHKADCIGLNWASSGDNNLWAYDTFTEVTGLDDTFTINVEFQVSVSHS